MTGIPNQIEIETVPEEDVSRRSFLQQGSACMAGGLFLPRLIQEALNFRQVQKKEVERLWGVAMAYCEGRLDLIDLDGNRLLH